MRTAHPLAAPPPREDPRDPPVTHDGYDFRQHAARRDHRARAGTRSPGGTAPPYAGARWFGDKSATVPVRGSSDTRIGYVRSGELDVIVLATAGLNRIGRGRIDEATEPLSPDTVTPAPGQGAPAVECAAIHAHLAAQLAELDDPWTRAAVTAERTLLAALEAGCGAPVGALADLLVDEQAVTQMRPRGVVGTPDGTTLAPMSTTGPVPASDGDTALPPKMGREPAAEMLAKRAAGLMGERAH